MTYSSKKIKAGWVGLVLAKNKKIKKSKNDKLENWINEKSENCTTV